MDIARFKKTPVMGILRGIDLSVIEPLLRAVIAAGLEAVEITMNTRNAPELIRKAKRASGKRLMIGAGTVLDRRSLKEALSAGATFIVTPTLIGEVTAYCVKNKIPVFPGALTPQEIYNAWNAGAAMVKVFPASLFGPAYFKEIKGPFNDVELMATGGVTPENIKSYFTSGASAVAFGASVFKKEWLMAGDFEAIGDSVKKYLEAGDFA